MRISIFVGIVDRVRAVVVGAKMDSYPTPKVKGT